jgi:hypothetical protein
MLVGGMTTVENERDAVGTLSIDLNNVFDGISYNVTVNKLYRYVPHDNTIQWIYNWLNKFGDDD